MSPDLAEALLGVYRALDRPVPLDVRYCHCSSCYPGETMSRILRTPYRELASRELYSILFDAHRLWGDWPDLAYYIPRMLECGYVERTYVDWEELLFEKLLQASRSDAEFWGEERRYFAVRSPMLPEERRSLARFFQTYLGLWVGMAGVPYGAWQAPEGRCLVRQIGFLAAFDEPVEPFLVNWRESPYPEARASYSLLLAELVLQQWSERRVFPDIGGRNPTALPLNEAFLLETLRPARVALYLAREAESAQLLPPGKRQMIELAFDWMASATSNG
jgi:hypothetical protein